MKCRICGAEVNGTRYCHMCGAAVNEETEGENSKEVQKEMADIPYTCQGMDAASTTVLAKNKMKNKNTESNHNKEEKRVVLWEEERGWKKRLRSKIRGWKIF